MNAIEIINLMNEWARPDFIDTWDNTGFQIGNAEREVNKVLLSLDLDKKVLERALEVKAQMIITHHPTIFQPLKSITTDTYKGDLIYKIIKNDIVVYNAHTNLDLTTDGVNDALANLLDIKNTNSLNIAYEESFVKLVVFVPKSHDHTIRKVLGEEGAGFIGNYSHCTYKIDGIGTFMPLEGANPYIGKPNSLEEVEETRIETIINKRDLTKILSRVLEAHPYEEVAYDIYPLNNKGKSYGYGRIGEIEKKPLRDYLDMVKEKLNTNNLIVYGNLDEEINKVAVCGGSGASFIEDAYSKGADIYITGDIKYHDAQYADELGLTLIDAGHYHTEKVILPVIESYIKENIDDFIGVELYNKSSPYYEFY